MVQQEKIQKTLVKKDHCKIGGGKIISVKERVKKLKKSPVLPQSRPLGGDSSSAFLCISLNQKIHLNRFTGSVTLKHIKQPNYIRVSLLFSCPFSSSLLFW